MRVDLLRHGSTGRVGFIDGRSDWPLTPEGREQMRRQTSGGHWSKIVASPLLRAREPATDVARRLSLTPEIDADWAEIDFGGWDGLSRADIAATPDGQAALAAFHAAPDSNPPPGGEPWGQFDSRILRALQRLVEMAGPVLVVTHAGPIRMALAHACGLPLDRLWALRIDYGTRVQLRLERAPDERLWGEIVEIVQP